MKFLLKRPKHFSESGYLAELVSTKYKDTPFKIHSYFVNIKSGFKRAKHYHKKKKEWMTSVCGKISLKMENIKTKNKKEYLLNSNSKIQKIIYVPPYWAHSIKAMRGDSVLVVFSLTPEDKSDSIPYEI